MEKASLTSLFSKSFRNDSIFRVSYEETDGSVLHGLVKAVAADRYEVLIEEKDVIIHCTKDETGALSCQLNRHGNPNWVDGISKQVEIKLKEDK